MKSTMLQNPSAPEATFRNKAGKEHRGYAANLEESVGTNGSVVTGYQYEQNNHSDSQFIREHLEQMDKQKERTVIATDGAYSGIENTQLAADKNVELITTSLTGSRLRISLRILNSTKREQKSSGVLQVMNRKTVLI
ncbi:MAG: hypothetical protein ACLU8S_14475 [Coprococcus phoceensis]